MSHPKLPIAPSSFSESQMLYQKKMAALQELHPLKKPAHMPNMPGITPSTKRFLTLKTLWYLLTHDEKKLIPRFILRKPWIYVPLLVRSYFKKNHFQRDEDFFFYGLNNEESFIKKCQNPDSLILFGFSYCHKPLECPSGRFTNLCTPIPNSFVCGQCYIGHLLSSLDSTKVITSIIPTVHDIGETLFLLRKQYPRKKILFLITACEMTLTMFADWGAMVQAEGIGVRLGGRICNTMKAFELSERGIKPGLTQVSTATQKRLASLIEKARLHRF